ncbi:MAG: 4-hydroxy-3-methylbut-2-enyl diphosphate reductase [Erysipelotrichaceae bacterium]|nr:4-hydroxy-3-methylbut-2-enyl diphosphate reductase [Erysipelotrichaceae bacterium]
MEILRVTPSGYCKGVVNAINIAINTRNKYPNENVYILGMIVHNSYVTKQLSDLGIITLDDSNTSKEELLEQISEGVVIFTAHGISDQIKQKAKDKGLITVDASCEDVIKNKELIKEYIAMGYDVIYFGKAKHPEALAVLSLGDKIHFVTKKEDIDTLEINNEKILITNQTTMSYLELQSLFDLVKEKYPTVLIKKEICNATSSRQQAVNNIVDADILYVVGDVKSNNTNKLAKIGETKAKKVFLISNKSEIKKEDLLEAKKVYVTAGASTPPVLIDEVISYLRELAAS